MADPQSFLDAIAAGDYDDELARIVEAGLERAGEVDLKFGWQISFDGDQWNVRNTKLGVLACAEDLLAGVDGPYPYVRIDPISYVTHLLALIAAHLHVIRGVPLAEARARVDRLDIADLDGMISVYGVPHAPKEIGGTSTSS